MIDRVVRRTALVLLLCIGFNLACSVGGFLPFAAGEHGDLTVELPGEPAGDLGPAKIEVSLEADSAVSAIIGEAGGVLAATDSHGTEYTLTVPAGALFTPVEMTMTPLAGASGDPIGDSPIVGVNLEPDGLGFLGLVTLDISGDLVGADAVGFGAGSGGEDFHLLPSEVSAGTVTLPILHFSMAGIGQSQLSDLAEDYEPSDRASAAFHQLAQQYQPGSELSGLAMGVTLIGWGRDLREALAQAEGTQEIENLTLELVAFTLIVNAYLDEFELSEDLPDVTGQLWEDWRLLVDQLVAEAGAACAQGQVDAAFDIFRWFSIGGFIDENFNIPDADQVLERWAASALGCMTFKLEYHVEVTNTGSGTSTPVITNAEGVVPTEEFVAGSPTGAVSAIVTALKNPESGITLSVPGQLEITGGPFGVCTGEKDGMLLGVHMALNIPNLGDLSGTTITGMTGWANVMRPVVAECPELQSMPAPVGEVFFAEPLDVANESRKQELGGSVVYRFELQMGGASGLAEFNESQMNLTEPGAPSKYDVVQSFTVGHPGSGG